LPEKTLLLLDGNSLINRAYFGLLGRHNLTAPDGTPTGALLACYNMFLRYSEELAPTHMVAAFDRKEPTFRHQAYDSYKATRKAMPDELAVQVPLMKDLLAASGVACLELAGYEADDLIGTLVSFGEQQGMHVFVVTGDKDSFQLVSDHVTILQPITRTGKSDTERYDLAAIKARYQVTPEQLIEVKAIMGDPSDNIPGVKGIGEKGAVELIARYGSLDGVYAALSEIKPMLAEKLATSRELAYLSRELSTICRDVPVNRDMALYQLHQPDKERLTSLLSRLGFKNTLTRLGLVASANATQPESNGALPERAEQPEGESAAASLILQADLAAWKKQLVASHSQSEGVADRKVGALYVAADRRAAWTTDGSQVDIFTAVQLADAWAELSDRRPAVFDYKALLHSTGLPPLAHGTHDVLVAAYLLNQIDGRPDLARIYERSTGEPLPDSLQPTAPAAGAGKKQPLLQPALPGLGEPAEPAELEESVDNMAANARIIHAIAAGQINEIADRHIEYLAYELEMPLTAILAGMEQVGFAIDSQVLDTLSAEMGERLDQLQAEIYQLCGRSFNLNSPKQLGDVLFGELGLATGKKSGSGAYSTDSEELERLAGEHPVIPLIIEHRQTAKLRSTYLEGLKKVLDPRDGRVHTTFNQTLTTTGRLSSSEPNLQNIPIRMEAGQKIRRAFVAAPGHVLIDADYSQIELRLLAHLSGDQAMIDAFVRAEDIHMNTACKIFGKSPLEITPEMRSIAKTMNFSIVYGISDFGLARDLGIPVRQAHNLIAEYEEQYPKVRQYLNGLVEAAYRLSYAETMYGRRRYLAELKSPNRSLRQFGERAAMNTPVQGTAADLIKIAMIRVDQGLRGARLAARLILQVHDELIVEAPMDEAAAAAAILKEAMEGAAQLQVPLVAEVRRGHSWADCK
jgi:DNA polymerase I